MGYFICLFFHRWVWKMQLKFWLILVLFLRTLHDINTADASTSSKYTLVGCAPRVRYLLCLPITINFKIFENSNGFLLLQREESCFIDWQFNYKYFDGLSHICLQKVTMFIYCMRMIIIVSWIAHQISVVKLILHSE